MTARDHLKPQLGAALVIVLWATLLLSTALAIAFASARIEARIAAARINAYFAHAAAVDGLEFAASAIATERGGRMDAISSLKFSINGYDVAFAPAPESEKLDINLAGEETIARFFRFLGEDAETAARLAARVADWRDEDGLVRPNGAEARDYIAARNGERIGDRPFYSADELKLVLEMPFRLAECAMPALTIFGDGSAPSRTLLQRLYGETGDMQARGAPARLGTASRSAAAGRRYAVTATAKKPDGAAGRPVALTGVFRITGARRAPYEWIAQFEEGEDKDANIACDIKPKRDITDHRQQW